MATRGATKGNQNALKHGFYSRRFKQQDIRNLDELSESQLPSLSSELALLRVALSRTFEQAEAGGEEADWSVYLADIGLAATRVASLLRTQKYLVGDQGDEVRTAIRRGVEMTSKDWV
jgi:hypothetical protein